MEPGKEGFGKKGNAPKKLIIDGVKTGKNMTTTAMKKDLRNKDTKKQINLATWNVQGTNAPGSLKTLALALEEYNIDIAAIQETKQKDTTITNIEKYIIFNSGDENKIFGTAFMVHKKWKETIIDFNGVSKRISVLRIRGKYRKISIMNIHAPTNNKEIEEKESFYEEVTEVYSKLPKYDIKIIIGDCNAQVGREEIYKAFTGGQSKHVESNENGKMLISLASELNLKIMSTHFQRKDIHKNTWISPDGKTANQIDHILVEERHNQMIKNVRSCRGAALDTDHFLVRIKFRQEFPKRREKRPNNIERYNMELLKNEETLKKFQLKLENIKEKTENVENIDENWKKLEENIKEAAKKVLTEKSETRDERRKNDWYDRECKNAIEIKNKLRMYYLQHKTIESKHQFEEKKREIKKLCRQKKRKKMEEKLELIERNYKDKEVRNFYQEAKRTKQGFQPQPIYCKDKYGQLVSGQDKINRWEEYFQDLLNENENNRSTESDEQDIEFVFQESEILDLQKEEMIEVLNKLKNNKSAGENGITGEMYRLGGEEIQEQTWKIISNVWNREIMPQRWREAVMVPIHKKGDKSLCENYRGIALLDVAYKIFATIIRNKLAPYTENILGEYQAGFRPNRSTTDQIAILKFILEDSYEHNMDTHMLFIDFKRAYDSILKKKVYEILLFFGIPPKLARIIKVMLEDTSCKVLVDGRVSRGFRTDMGLRQGDPVAPLLFNLVLEWVVRKSGLHRSGTLLQHKHLILAYADDIVMITRSKIELLKVIKALILTAYKVGLEINEDKTKYMVMSSSGECSNSLKMNLETKKWKFQTVEEFCYLGVILTNRASESVEIETRIAKGNRCLGGLYKLLVSKKISRAAKIRLYKTVIRPTVLYGCDTWVLNKSDEKKLGIWERKILRLIYGGKKVENLWFRRTNIEVMELYGEPDIIGIVKSQRVRWLGHVWRLNDSRSVKIVLSDGMSGKRRRGRPRKKWYKSVIEDINKLKVSEWRTVTKNRSKWRRIVEEAKGLHGLES